MADSLLTDLVSWWPLNEADSVRLDAHGDNHLSDQNTVLSAAGLGGRTAADFVATNSEYLSVPDRSNLRCGDRDLTIAGWFRIDGSRPWYPHPVMVSKRAGSIDWQIGIEGTVSPGFIRVWFAGSSVPGPAGGVVANQWYHVIAWHDKAAAVIRLQINGGTVISAATPVLTSTTDGLAIGRAGTLGLSYLPGLIQDVAVWSRVLTADERSRLYGAGAGLTYSDIAAPVASSRPVLSSPYLIGSLR